ncbi:MAG: HAD-IIB family hydrolase [Candidatus Woesearchaeota archaeon]
MKIIATDLDRTLLPNGSQKKDAHIYKKLRTFLKKHDIGVIYVTGRRKEQIPSVIQRYNLPRPLYCITNVGTQVYAYSRGKFILVDEWEKQLHKQWKPGVAEMVEQKLTDCTLLRPQSPVTQNQFKRSYLADPNIAKSRIEKTVAKRLQTISYQLTYSIDANRNIAQIDIMPPKANKKNALQFLLKHLHPTDVLTAGDSGNDLSMLTHTWKSVLVKNAKGQVKMAYKEHEKPTRRYIATGVYEKNSGNYASGIIEALLHYDWIKRF